MRRRTLNRWQAVAVAAFMAVACSAQQTFKGIFWSEEEGIYLRLDLYEETLPVPGMDYLGQTNGYMEGNVYGIWMVTSSRIKNRTATVKLANDFGSESQVITLTAENDSTLLYKAKEPAVIKRAVKRKLVKIPDTIRFIRKR